MQTGKIAVIGAGVMGSDVALNLSCYGYDVVLKDLTEAVLDTARAKIAKDLRMVKFMRPDLKALDDDAVLERIHFTRSFDSFGGVEWVIENVSENWEVKKKAYLELAPVCQPDTIYCINTSCISITKVASLLPRPDRVIGMHFMNPVPLKEMVEVVRGHHTSEQTVTVAKQFLKSFGTRAVVVNDSPGFVANRLSHLFMNEAAFLIQDQVASPRDVDLIFKNGYGHKMGPLETADLIGLDTVVDSLEVLYAAYQDSKFRCCPLLKRMVDAGLLGRKSGEGFYKY